MNDQLETSDDKISVIQTKCDEYLSGWKRALADYDNIKKDLSREKEELRNYVKEQMAEQLIPVLDSFDQVNRHTPAINVTEEDALKFQNWLNGLRLVQAQLETIMRNLGLESIATAGAFDPMSHEAVGERAEEGKEQGQILEVMQGGWKLGEKVVRPAKVITSK